MTHILHPTPRQKCAAFLNGSSFILIFLLPFPPLPGFSMSMTLGFVLSPLLFSGYGVCLSEFIQPTGFKCYLPTTSMLLSLVVTLPLSSRCRHLAGAPAKALDT